MYSKSKKLSRHLCYDRTMDQQTETTGFARSLVEGIPDQLPPAPVKDHTVSHAPPRRQVLTTAEKKLALGNALRYFPASQHKILAPEFTAELEREGRIYMHRFRPSEYAMAARPIGEYPARCAQAASIMLMIQNNLDPAVAQHPHELITYGGNGTVFQNWAQYRITMQYLSEMTEEQTLVLYSGHPLGLFPSHRDAPRLVVTNGMVVPNHSSPDDYERLAALGVTSYGQMTAGSFMYIGPQGIVHGTTITLMNAARKYLGSSGDDLLQGKVFVTSGMGGMSGAQAKAAVIAGAVGVIAEINPEAIWKRHEQGWLDEVETDLDKLLARIEQARTAGEAVSLGYLGNVVDLWEKLAGNGVAVDLGSDQTSLHNPFGGGYYPVGLTLQESNRMMADDPERFKEEVRKSLVLHVNAVNRVVDQGMHFWDYGNAFLLEAARAGAPVTAKDGSFIYPSYVEDIMGPMCFDFGFGPFRWVCTSGDTEDLRTSDHIAARVLEEMATEAPPETRQQLLDNQRWISQAEQHAMVVGTKARILYSDEEGRKRIALAFNPVRRHGGAQRYRRRLPRGNVGQPAQRRRRRLG
jgi:urocanate hydratase